MDGDHGRRVQFCRFLLHTEIEDGNFLRSILWTDESRFSREGIVNLHNLHSWAQKDENPRLTKSMSFQVKFSVNVWAGVIGRSLIGLHYLLDRLNGDNYLEFLQNDLSELLNEVPIF